MSRFEDPCIITCSISGAVANREQCPAIPYTPEEYAAEARRAVDEGAAMIHIHARTPDGVPSYEVEDFRAITEAIAGAVDDVIVNYSTGAIGVPVEKRIAYLRELRPDVAALNMGSMNYAKYSRSRKDFVFKAVFENSFDTIIEFLRAMNELGIRPEHECFDTGHVANLDPLLDMGLLSEPLQISCVMGVTGGVRPSPRNLAHMADQIPGGPEGPNNWGVIGISRDQWRLVAAAAALGGNVRVGLEDNFYLPDGEMARSNGDLIARARRMVEDTGRRRRERGRGARAARHAAAGERVSGALEGVRVLDLSRLLPGGFCSLLLADFGADVLKVEDTGMGDYLRWSPPYHEGADDSAKSALFLSLNRGKRSIRLNLKEEAGREVLLRLVREHDVLLESFRPGVMERLGVGYERLREENPGLVYCAITATARTGPTPARSGHDMNYLGLNGLLGLTGDAGGPPVQSAGQIADLGGGALMAAFGILAALRERERSGEGQLVDVSMFDGSLSWLAHGGGALPVRRRSARARRGSSWRAGCSATGPTPAATAGSRSARSSPSSGRPGAAGVGREDLIEKQFERPGSDAHAEVERDLRRAHAQRVARVRRAPRLLPRARARRSTRRSTPSWCGRARWWWRSTSRAPAACACWACR